jgi:hypothetical protein
MSSILDKEPHMRQVNRPPVHMVKYPSRGPYHNIGILQPPYLGLDWDASVNGPYRGHLVGGELEEFPVYLVR